MQHYFIKGKKEDFFYLDSSDEHHIRHVMRFHNGENVYGIYQGKKYLCELKITDKDLYLNPLKTMDAKDKNYNLTLIQALPKGDKFDLILQKATELGVDNIVPFLSERSIVRIEKKDYEKKIERWKKIVKEASEQSERLTIPTIYNPCNLKELLSYFKGEVLLMDERKGRKESQTLFEYLLKSSCKEFTIIVGPEGGFSDNEFNFFEEYGVQQLSLGSQILRSETAAIVSCALVGASKEK